jgi:hypothetical protein
MSHMRSFYCQGSRFSELIASTRNWLIGKKFNCQQLLIEDGGVLIQIEKRGGWRKVVGMSTALNIVFRQVENTVNVEIKAGRWLDKAAAGTVSLFILWPLAVTAGIGAWRQTKMPERIFGHIATFIEQQEKKKQFSVDMHMVKDIVLKARNIPQANRDKALLDKALVICDNLLKDCEIPPIETYDVVYHRALVLWLCGNSEQAKEDLIDLIKQQENEQIDIDRIILANIYELLAEISINQNKHEHAMVFLSKAKDFGKNEMQRKFVNTLRQIREQRAAVLCKEPGENRQIMFCTNEIPSWITQEFCFSNTDTLRATGWKFEVGHPQLGIFYVCHPLRSDRYYALEEFHDKVFDDKQAELVYLLQSIGANHIHVEAIKDILENNSSSTVSNRCLADESFLGISGKDSGQQQIGARRHASQSGMWDIELQPVKSPYIPKDLVWYYHEPTWQQIAQSAVAGNYKKITLELRYQEDFSINSKRIKQIEAGLIFFSQKEGLQWSKETEELLQKRKRTVWKFTACFSELGTETTEVETSSLLKNVTTEETEYVEELEDCFQDGVITSDERRILERRRQKLGLSEKRATELEGIVKDDLKLE